ncbi:MAG: hypothetical protein H6711_08425 [Myxococcales bacterium]|nr:hypothetical protein [Myxococcales bacterium]
MDIAAALDYLDGYAECTEGCLEDEECGEGFKCAAASDPCACGTCQACKAAKVECTSNDECCSGVCSGKRRKVCK